MTVMEISICYDPKQVLLMLGMATTQKMKSAMVALTTMKHNR